MDNLEYRYCEVDAEREVRNVLVLGQCTFDEGVKRVAEKMRVALCRSHCGEEEAAGCEMWRYGMCGKVDEFFREFCGATVEPLEGIDGNKQE